MTRKAGTTSIRAAFLVRQSQALERRHRELTEKVNGKRRDIREESTRVAVNEVRDTVEASSDELRSGVDRQMAEQFTQELRQVEAAQRRMEEGKYGICVKPSCGKEIAEQRLVALPYALTCIDCARKTAPPQRRFVGSEVRGSLR